MKVTANLETLKTTNANGGNVYVCHWQQDIEPDKPRGAQPDLSFNKKTTSYREWAIFVVHDGLGLLSIVSAFGNWSHCWAPRHLAAPTLHDFLGRMRDPGYVMSKLAKHDEWHEVSFEETKTQLLCDLLERRREQRITRDLARERFDELVQWNESDPYPHWSFPDWITDPWERTREVETGTAEAFRLQIWPVLQKCLQDELARREQIAFVVP